MRLTFARQIRRQSDAKATAMDCFIYPIQIAKTKADKFERMEALVDTGSSYTTVPTFILTRLGIAPSSQRTLFMADGSAIRRDAAETRIRIDNRQTGTFVVFGDDDSVPLLGAYSLEGLGLGVDAVNGRLIRTPKVRQ